jgi:hypothetical protein
VSLTGAPACCHSPWCSGRSPPRAARRTCRSPSPGATWTSWRCPRATCRPAHEGFESIQRLTHSQVQSSLAGWPLPPTHQVCPVAPLLQQLRQQRRAVRDPSHWVCQQGEGQPRVVRIEARQQGRPRRRAVGVRRWLRFRVAIEQAEASAKDSPDRVCVVLRQADSVRRQVVQHGSLAADGRFLPRAVAHVIDASIIWGGPRGKTRLTGKVHTKQTHLHRLRPCTHR